MVRRVRVAAPRRPPRPVTAMRVRIHPADLGACGHYRLIWPAQRFGTHWRGDPVAIELVQPGTPAAAFDARADIEATYARHGFAAVTEQLETGTFDPRDMVLGRLADDIAADVVVLQRPLTNHLVDIVRILQADGIAVVVETDDSFEHIHRRNIAHHLTARTDRHKNADHLAAACELADWVTVTTPALADIYGRHGRVSIIPNYIPDTYYQTEDDSPRGRGEVRVGWSGSLDTHPGDLEVTHGAVAAVLDRYGLGFYHIGKPSEQAAIRRALQLRPSTPYGSTGGWLPLAQYPKAVAMLDIGIVPLAAGPFNEAKSWLKGLELAALGRPFVASPTGPYVELAEQHGIGILARSRRDWRNRLAELVEDPDLRYDVGRQNRRRARALALERNLDPWRAAWSAALDNRKAQQ